VNRALLPVPSAAPSVSQSPARRAVAEPSTGTKRTQWLLVSATHSVEESADSASATGKLNFAPVPLPSEYPALEEPASVVTKPAGETFRTRWLYESATKTLSEASTARPWGLKKDAAEPEPSAAPSAPNAPQAPPLPPARRLAVPVEVTTLRRQWLNVSATNSVAGDARAPTMPIGMKNCALAQAPSA